MRGWLLLGALALLGVGLFLFLRRLDGGHEMHLGADGSVFMGRRRIAAGDDADLAKRLKAHLKSRRPLPDPLVLDVEPGSVAEDLVLILWAARWGGDVKRIQVRLGEREETLSLDYSPVIHRTMLWEVRLRLCARGDLRGHRQVDGHGTSGSPGERVATGVEHGAGATLGRPGREPNEDACFDALRTEVERFVKAGPWGTAPPQREFGILHACPGVPVEYVLRGCRTLREAGAGEPTIIVSGVGGAEGPDR